MNMTRRFFTSILGAAAATIMLPRRGKAWVDLPWSFMVGGDWQYENRVCNPLGVNQYVAGCQAVLDQRDQTFTSPTYGTFSANTLGALSVGDNTDDALLSGERSTVQTGFSLFDNNSMPKLSVPGNHDGDSSGVGWSDRAANLGAHFKVGGYLSASSQQAVFGSGMSLGGSNIAEWIGAYDGTGQCCAWRLTVYSRRFLFISLSFWGTSDQFNWAYSLILANPDCEVVLTPHAWLTKFGGRFYRNTSEEANSLNGPDKYTMGAAPLSLSAEQAWSSASGLTVPVKLWPRVRAVFGGHDITVSVGGSAATWFYRRLSSTSESSEGQRFDQFFWNAQQLAGSCGADNPATCAGQFNASLYMSYLPPHGIYVNGKIEVRGIARNTGNYINTGASGNRNFTSSEVILYEAHDQPLASTAATSNRGVNLQGVQLR